MIHLSTHTFSHAVYDSDGDVLYMSAGEPRAASDAVETPEGHVVRFGDEHQVIGVTIINAKWWLEREGEIKVTLPDAPAVVERREVEAVLAA